MKQRGLLVVVALVVLIAVPSMQISARSALSSASETTNPSSTDCVVWKTKPGGASAPETCTLSKPWWTAWFDCPVTPVEGGLWPARRAGDDGLARIPWVQAEPSASGVVAHLFSGSRPLHTDNHFPDGARAKVLWTFPRPVSRFAMTATDLGNPGTPLTIWEVDADGTASDASDQVPTYLDIPSAGCWRVEVRAQDEAGEFMASATFVVIDG